ncbi:MAG: hypothetical protein CEO12_156 [Parcubacteria group bacterium Gr01-1014_46]|nr:MAG: hypothetical protein CEO12_156 [Parcubacteria group bacterium Gr01-1014_46]
MYIDFVALNDNVFKEGGDVTMLTNTNANFKLPPEEKVTWIDPSEAGDLAETVTEYIRVYGREGLTLHSTTNSTALERNIVLATLRKDGKILPGTFIKSLLRKV